MPRALRASPGGYCYHALNRGNELARMFHDADDYHGLVALLRQACARVPMRLIGYCALEEDAHLLTVLRYVERNPLRAGLVCQAEDWPWSSLPVWLHPPLMPWLDPRSSATARRLAGPCPATADRG